jgi:hypothetical protein
MVLGVCTPDAFLGADHVERMTNDMTTTITYKGAPNLGELVTEAKGLRLELGRPMLDTIADLTWQLNQAAVRAAGGILPAPLQRAYTELTDVERAGMRSGVERVFTALILLGVVQEPERDDA